MYDFIIKNGTILDGSGADAYQADIAIQNGKIAAIAPDLSKEDALNCLDAAGLTVTPGFIDAHSHSETAILSYPEQKEKLEQGITLSVTGHCGDSQAPRQKDDRLYKMSDFLEEASAVPQGSGAANLVGYGTVRAAVMARENRKPTPEEMEQIKALLKDAMEAGAYGMSFGLIYVPSCYADTEELIEAAKVVASYDGVVSAHLRNENDFLLESIEEFLTVIRGSGARGVISHLKAMEKPNWGKTIEAIRMIEAANEEGLSVHCDAYPYSASYTSLIARVIPAQFHPEGTKNALDLLDNPTVMNTIRAWAKERWQGDLSWFLITSCRTYPEYAGKRMDEIASLRGSDDQLETCYEILRETGGKINACFFTMCEEDIERVLSYPRSMICTDCSCAEANAVYHPRLRASFPRALARYVRERGTTSLPEMIRKMTSLPASVYGIEGKGQIKPGFDADLCIFDAGKIKDNSDYTHCTDKNEGLSYVFVAGEIVVTDGVSNGKRNAKVLRANR